MKNTILKYCFGGGFSLVEGIIAMLVIAIVILGTLSMRVQSAVDLEKADAGESATRLALLFNEAWRGEAGTNLFNPMTAFAPDLDIEQGDGPEPPSGFNLQGKYTVQLNDCNYYITLSYQDMNAQLRALNSNVAWEQRGTPQMDYSDADKLYSLSVFVNR